MGTVEGRTTPRLRERPWDLVRHTVGRPKAVRQKLRELASVLRGYGSRDRVGPRLERLARLGYIEQVPTLIQRMVGSIDMMRFWIVPCADDYYRSKGISFEFHTVLRLLDEPASVIDPTGLNSTADTIIAHVLQVVHANPVYDFQLLESFETGLEEMERQTVAVLDGTHPRAESIGAIVEDPEYHQRLLEYVRAYRRDRSAPPLLRENVMRRPEFRMLEHTFGSLPNVMRYFAKLPDTPLGGARHLLLVREFPAHLAG